MEIDWTDRKYETQRCLGFLPACLEWESRYGEIMRHHFSQVISRAQAARVRFCSEPRTEARVFVNGHNLPATAVVMVVFDGTFSAIEREIITAVCVAFLRGLLYGTIPDPQKTVMEFAKLS